MARNNLLDGMRGIAALCVVFYHAQAVLGFQLSYHGYLAVDLFFVLSGYVISQSYDYRFAKGMSCIDFALIRVKRFYPLYFAGLALGLMKWILYIVTYPSGHAGWGDLVIAALCSLAFIPTRSLGDDMFPLNVPSWSLFFELVVNVLYRGIFQFFTMAVIAVMCFILKNGTVNIGAMFGDFWGGGARTIFSFFVGVGVSRLEIRPKFPYPFVVIIVLITALCVRLDSAYYDIIFVFLLSPLLVAIAGVNTKCGIASRTFNYLGVLSFPIYAIHRPVLQFAEAISIKFHIPGAVVGGGAIIAMVSSGKILERYDEVGRAYLNLLHNKMGKWRNDARK